MNALVVIPTFNEISTLGETLQRLRTAVPEAHVLIVDDNSPDGTGELADEIASSDAMIAVLHRPDKSGLGRAYLAGFAWGLARGFTEIVEMDADASHRPEQLPRLLAALGEADLVIGSRWITGGAVHNWPAHRLLLSRGANMYTRIWLSLPVADATAGFRVYTDQLLRQLMQSDIASHGYCFQVDMTRRAVDLGAVVKEVPIDFDERSEGVSKMSAEIVREALLNVTLWGITNRWHQLSMFIQKILNKNN